MAKSKDTVVIGFVHPTDVSAYFLMSLMGTTLHEMVYGNNRIGGVINEFSGANISQARNKIAADFLDNYESEWLLFIDADMQFHPEAVEKLLRHAHETDRPIMGALCFGIDEGRLFPTLYDLARDGDKVRVLRRHLYDDNAVTEVSATGGAFLLIHRSVLVAIRGKGFNKAFPWFQETQLDEDSPCSEDFTFCLRARQLGIPVHVDTAVKIGHHKSIVLTHEMYQSQLAAVIATQEEARGEVHA
jgi:GT2 family glycosyltransferase